MDSKKVVVIGGGIVGSSIAYKLSELVHMDVVIDRGPFQES